MGYLIRFKALTNSPDDHLRELALAALQPAGPGGAPRYLVWVDDQDQVVLDCRTGTFDEALRLAKQVTRRFGGAFGGGDLELDQVTEIWPQRVAEEPSTSPLGDF